MDHKCAQPRAWPYYSHFFSPHPMLPCGLGLTPGEGGLSTQSRKATRLGSMAPRVHKSHGSGTRGLGVWQRDPGKVTAWFLTAGGNGAMIPQLEVGPPLQVCQPSELERTSAHPAPALPHSWICPERSVWEPGHGLGLPAQCSSCWTPCPVLFPPCFAVPCLPFTVRLEKTQPLTAPSWRAVVGLSCVMSGFYLNEQPG